MEIVRDQQKSSSHESLKLAITMALVRSKLLQKPPAPPPPQPPPSSFATVPQPATAPPPYSEDALKWKRKAKERKLEILRLKEDLKVAEERDNENNVDQLSTSVDFLVELCDSISPQSLEKGNFKNWCHQAVDFILGTLATMSPAERIAEPVEGIINSLIMRLLRRMFSALEGESHHFDTAVWFYIQHLMRKVGNEAFVGQRLIFAVSQRIYVVAESLLFMDPFDDAFSCMHNSMFRMIQLIEFLVSDYLLTWSNTGDFDTRLFEEWVISVLHGRKALELLENRISLYVLYIDRVIGVVAKQVGQLSFLQKLDPQILENLFS